MKSNGTLRALSHHLDELLRTTEHVLLEDSDPELAAILKERVSTLPKPTASQPQPTAARPPKAATNAYDYRPETMFSRQPPQRPEQSPPPWPEQSPPPPPPWPEQSSPSHSPSQVDWASLIEESPQDQARQPAARRDAPKNPESKQPTPNRLWADDANLKEANSIEMLIYQVRGCMRCKLHQSRTNLVFGQGNSKAKVMFIGEGPGMNEDKEGLAFVGRSGRLLTQMMLSIGLNREDVYIANVVKCRPPDNRNPEADESAACRPILARQIELVAPKLIVALGKVALQNLVPGSNSSINAVHGQQLRTEFGGGIDLIPTFHPSYLLRDHSKMTLAWDDLRRIRQHLASAS